MVSCLDQGSSATPDTQLESPLAMRAYRSSTTAKEHASFDAQNGEDEHGMTIGRPRKSPEDKHTKTVRVPLRPSDFARLQEKADKAETTITDFVRASALGQKFTVIQSDAPDFDTIEQLRRIGVNLNQIAKRLNERKSVAPDRLESTLADLQTLLARWMFDDPQNHHRPQL